MTTSPPSFISPEPTIKLILPDVPSTAAPLDKVILPEVPPLEIPVRIFTSPLTPDEPAFAVTIWALPVEPNVLWPVMKFISPLLPTSESPEETNNEPPLSPVDFPKPAPPWIYNDPPLPP